ncbi:hypothetical protein [Desulfosporosinus meridiei]|uniref:hypothetical protein n=1 Tax=Desulfosporosinus meridiei TaxID=79209 RepID=UPI00031F9459|nr:hypothetical protein [Desulfosporosinus meridiei]
MKPTSAPKLISVEMNPREQKRAMGAETANPMLATLVYYRKARELGVRFISGARAYFGLYF